MTYDYRPPEGWWRQVFAQTDHNVLWESDLQGNAPALLPIAHVPQGEDIFGLVERENHNPHTFMIYPEVVLYEAVSQVMIAIQYFLRAEREPIQITYRDGHYQFLIGGRVFILPTDRDITELRNTREVESIRL